MNSRHITSPFQIVKDFEDALAIYTGAPYVVTTTSCTMALLLAVAWHLRGDEFRGQTMHPGLMPEVEIPKRTYVGVPMAIVHAGGRPAFRDEDWGGCGYYRLAPLPVWDAARIFTGGMWQLMYQHFNERTMFVCVSFHWSKTLGIQQGGAILHNDPRAHPWLKKARFDGRTEGVAPADDVFDVMGWHAYMSPEVAAGGMVRLANLPRHNAPIPPDNYRDLSELEIFK